MGNVPVNVTNYPPLAVFDLNMFYFEGHYGHTLKQQ